MEFQIRTDSIHRGSDGRWEVKYTVRYGNGRKPYSGCITADTYDEACAAAARLMSEGSDLSCDRAETMTEPGTYGDCLDGWLVFIQPRVKESTFIRYRNIVDNHIRPRLGCLSIQQIGTSKMEEYVSELLRDGRLDRMGGLSSKSVSDILTVVKETFRYSVSHGVEHFCCFDRLSVKSYNREMRVLSRQEELAFVSVLKEDTDRYKAGMLLALYTGIRIGELCALKWSDISLDDGILCISRTMQRLQKVDAPDGDVSRTHIVITEPKSAAGRRLIPLPQPVRGILSEFRAPGNAYLLSGLPSSYVEPRVLKSHFKRCLRQSGVRDANFHSLRHTFATRCVEAGFDLKSLSEILGHSSVKITLDKYVHSTMEQKRVNMERLFPTENEFLPAENETLAKNHAK